MSVYEDLYNLVFQTQELDALMDDHDISEEAVLDAIEQHEYDLKAEGVKLMDLQDDMMMRAETARAVARVYKEQADKYFSEAKRQDNRRDKLMEMIKGAMKAMNEKIIPAGKKEFFLKKNGGKPKLVIDDPSKVPMEYCKHEPDKDKIREYLATLPEDIVCGWAHLEKGEHVEIKAGK